MSQFNVTVPTWNGAPIQNVGGKPAVAGQPTNYNPATSGTNYTGGAAPQTPSIFGTGTFVPPAYPINYGAITGSPTQGAATNYGLNDVYGNLQNALNNLQVRNYSATAPQGTAPVGTAGQASASTYQAPTGTASSYTAPQGSASGYGAAFGQGSGYSAAQGAASSTGQVAGQAALGNAAYADPTRISTAGDLAWQTQQQQLANILARQAAGGGMSPADIQLQQGTQNNIAAQLAVLGSQRGGGNFALAQRSAADQAAAADATLNQQMGLQRANETIQAQQALGNVLGTARGQAQAYNLNQAQLLQALKLQNAGFTQGMTLADLAAINSQTQQNVGLAQQANQFNAGQAQNMTLADMLAQNQALQFGAANSQQAMLANQAAQNAANQYNATNSQQMDLANLLARQSSLQYNAGNSQQMALANLTNQANALQYNAGNTQAMTLADLVAQNQFGMANLENAQQMGLTNLGLAGQYGLANQSAAVQAQNQYDQQLLALLGAQTGIGTSNRAAQLAANQLGVQQNTALNQIAAEAYASSAQANANLTGGIIGGIAGIGAPLINGLVNSGGGGNLVNMPGYSVDPTQGGATAVDVIPQQANIPVGTYPTLSDENVKTGIEGGNPMLDSFLRQYQEARGKTEDIDPDSGLGFHVQRYARGLSGGTPGSTLGSQIGSTAGGLAGSAGGAAIGSVVPGIGTIIGGLIGGFVGSNLGGDVGSLANTKGSGGGSYSQMTSPATGLQPIGIDDAETQEVSDENEKEAVTSGNRGMQQFLEQANAQTGAQNQQGSYNNAFMASGGPPPPQVNTQMPPNVNAGYGQPSLLDILSAGYGGGGISDFGGYYGGGYQGGGMTGMGGISPAAMLGMGSEYGAGITSAGGYSGAGMSNPGSYSAGGITRSPTLSGGSASATPQMVTTQFAPFAGAMTPAANPNTQVIPRQGPGVIAGAPAPAVTKPAPYVGALTPAANPATIAQPYTQAPGTGYGTIAGPGIAPAAAPATTSFVTNTPALRLSDERAKVPDTSSVRQMLDGLEAHQYRYKDPSAPGAGAGTYVSPMAQELEQTDLGKDMVIEGPGGVKMVDYGKGFGTMLAGQAMLHQRVSDLESILRRRAA